MKEMAHTPGPWIVPQSVADMPVKPGIERYEYVDCLVLYKGELLCRPWNCEHQVFDDEHRDDHFCDWDEVQAYRPLANDREAAMAAINGPQPCPVCSGDCSSANPPVASCPMSLPTQQTKEQGE